MRNGAQGVPESGHFAECPHCFHDPRRATVEEQLRRCEHDDRAALVRAGGDWPAHQVAVRNVLGSVMHLWRGKSIDVEVLKLAVAAVHLGAATALLEHDDLCDADHLRELREFLLRWIDERMTAAPSIPAAVDPKNFVHGPTGPCTRQTNETDKPGEIK